MEVEDYLDAKLTSREVADAFGVKPGTVSSWVSQKRLKGSMPRRARRKGRFYTLKELLLFAQCAEDDGDSERQLREYLKRNGKEILALQATRNISTSVLSS